jgi:hypothetical protein
MTDLHSCSFDIFGTQSGLTKDQSQSKPDDPYIHLCNCPSFGAKLAHVASLKCVGSRVVVHVRSSHIHRMVW